MKTRFLLIPLFFLLLFGINNYAQEKTNKSGGEYLLKADVMPEPVGGIEAIMNKVHYPEIAKRAGIEGKVYVLTNIDEYGNVVKTKIIKGIGSGCNEAAMKAVKETKFTPGENGGKKVKTQVTIPIYFKLGDKKDNKK